MNEFDYPREDDGNREHIPGYETESEHGEPNQYLEIGIPILQMFKDCLLLQHRFKGPAGLARDCLIIALGWGGTILQDQRLEIVASRYRNAKGQPMTKAHASALVKKFQAILNLGPLPGQRSLAGCKNMRDSRAKQTTTKGSK